MCPMRERAQLREHLLRIVRGQVRSHMHDHPEFYSDMGRSRGYAVADGIAKRAVPDILTVLSPWCGRDGGEGGLHPASPTKDPAGVAASAPAGHSSKRRSEEHTSELQSLMRISYAVFCLKKQKQHIQ